MRRRAILDLLLADLTADDYLVSDLLDEPVINGEPGVLLRRDDLEAFPVVLGPFAARFLALRPAASHVLHPVDAEPPEAALQDAGRTTTRE